MDDIRMTQDKDLVVEVRWSTPHSFNEFLRKTGRWTHFSPRTSGGYLSNHTPVHQARMPRHGSTTQRGGTYRFYAAYDFHDNGAEVTTQRQTGTWDRERWSAFTRILVAP